MCLCLNAVRNLHCERDGSGVIRALALQKKKKKEKKRKEKKKRLRRKEDDDASRKIVGLIPMPLHRGRIGGCAKHSWKTWLP